MDAGLRGLALALGYNEAVSLTFISHADAETFSSAQVLELENPLSEEASVMRTSMAPGMLDMLAWNLNRDSEDVRLFEMGRVYEMRGGERVEPARACLGATMAAVKGSLAVGGMLDVSKDEQAAAAEAFRSFKGDVENLLAAFAYGELSFDRETAEYFHAGRSARALMDRVPVAEFGQTINPLGWVKKVVRTILRCVGSCKEPCYDQSKMVCPTCGGKLEKSVQRKQVLRKLRQDVFLAEIDLEELHARGLRTVRFAALAKYPAVERDFSFVFSDDVEFEAMRRAVTELGIPELREFKPVEIFRGGAIGTGKYSILLRVRLQSDDGTLRDEQIAQWSEKIVAALSRLGGVQRA
jgi:phenylalanyl-tRNA synthetase beta chain